MPIAIWDLLSPEATFLPAGTVSCLRAVRGEIKINKSNANIQARRTKPKNLHRRMADACFDGLFIDNTIRAKVFSAPCLHAHQTRDDGPIRALLPSLDGPTVDLIQCSPDQKKRPASLLSHRQQIKSPWK
jgi:hypothetical protein